MPYQGDTAQAHRAPAPDTPTAARTVTVIPAVDLYLGTVTIMAKGGTTHFQHTEAPLIARALARAVRPTQWCEASRTLTVTVAAVGKREGVQQRFTFDQGKQA